MEWIDYQSSLCSGCGHPKAESMDEANADRYEAVPLTCYACATRDAEQRSVADRLDTTGNRRRGGLDRSSTDGAFIAVVEKGVM